VWLDIDSSLQSYDSKWLDSSRDSALTRPVMTLTRLVKILDDSNSTLTRGACDFDSTLTRQKWLGHITGLQGDDTWCLKGNIARLDSQNRKFAPILNITEAKKSSFLCVQTHYWACPSEAQRFCKSDCDSSRVTIFLSMTRVK